MEPEWQAERDRRRYQRGLFDRVARLYAATRPGYPAGLVSFVATTAGLRTGAAVLEIGCGTGQLTQRLVACGFTVTAIDIGPSMIETARERVPGARFQTVSFEALDAAAGSFDLVISGAAFHWIDPEVRFAKAARLLRPGGWLALAGGDETYDDPVGPALAAMWLARSANGGAWAARPGDAAAVVASGLFAEPVQRSFPQRLTRAAGDIIGVENTRATALSWPDEVRAAFNAELRQLLGRYPAVGLTYDVSVAMAQALTRDVTH